MARLSSERSWRHPVDRQIQEARYKRRDIHFYRRFGGLMGGCLRFSPIHRAALEDYIGNQAEHHRIGTFQEEYRRLLEKYGIEYDERYVWD